MVNLRAPVVLDGGSIQDSNMNIVVNPEVRADYQPGAIRSAKSAYTASMHVLFSHVADFHELVVRIISQKYGIPEEEILKVVMEHPEYTAMQVNPVIQSLGYFDQADADRVAEKPKVIRKKKKIVIVSEGT